MKKILLVLLALTFFLGLVSAVSTCTVAQIGNSQIQDPNNGTVINQGNFFTFRLFAICWDGGSCTCNSDITFKYDKGTSGAEYVRIKDSSPFNPGVNYLEVLAPPNTYQEAVIVNGVTGVYLPVTVKCNAGGTYILQGSFGTTTVPYTRQRTIYCIGNSPPTGYFVAPAFDTVIYKKDSGGNPDLFTYRIQWEANDSEGDALSYIVNICVDGFCAGNLATSNKYYDVPIANFGEFTFNVTLKDTVNGNQTIIMSESVFVKKKNFTSLSIEDLNLTPEAIYGDGKIYVTVTVRNNSPDIVDINTVFYNAAFPGGSYSFPTCPTCAQQNIQPFSKATFYISTASETGHSFAGNPLTPGDYNVRVLIQERLAGQTTVRNEIQSFAHFVVLDEVRPVSVPETNLLTVILISFAVVFIARKKTF